MAPLSPLVPRFRSQRVPADPVGGALARARLVLETPKGRLPWRPSFGCDLDAFVGRPLDGRALRSLSAEIERALDDGAPQLQVLDVQAEIVGRRGFTAVETDRTIPVAEGALVRFGTQAAVQVDLTLATPAGPVAVAARFGGPGAS
jgi:phage baseplate assembly protein W